MITIDKLITWLKANRYKHYNLAQTLRIRPATVSQWKLRGRIPAKYQPTLKLIVKGEKKLTLKPLKK